MEMRYILQIIGAVIAMVIMILGIILSISNYRKSNDDENSKLARLAVELVAFSLCAYIVIHLFVVLSQFF